MMRIRTKLTLDFGHRDELVVVEIPFMVAILFALDPVAVDLGLYLDLICYVAGFLGYFKD
jgi:hypothetical protein